MIFVDITVTGVALPSIGADLGVTTQALSWVTNAYLVALAALMALGGRTGDIIGKRSAFLAGVAVFAGASIVCASAPTMELLLTGRILQGLGAALMQPASASLVIENFAPGERGKAMGIYIGIPMTFFAIGPVLGGLVTEFAGWRWVFYVNLPIAIAAIALAIYARPANIKSADRAIDPISVLLLLFGVPLSVIALQEGGKVDAAGTLNILEPRYFSALAAGLICCTLFVRRQFRIAKPLIRLALFRDRALLADALLIGIMQFAMAGIIVEGSIYAQEVLHFSPTRAGASLMPMLVPVIFLAQVAGRRYDRLGVRPLFQ